ncbi:MAG: hypothetical protein U5L08_01355 [Xanthomonadales bacterium]|nr:hypothetical protein [Xanthomonadales bacterium]
MKSFIRILALTTLFALSVQTASAALPGGISGHWYNPAQSGHGITLLLVQPDFAQAVWHVYDPDGNPLTLVIEGEVSGHGMQGPVYAPRGMRFGEFNPDDNEVTVWGEASIEFSSCSRAELSWDASDPAYGEGSMQLHRLAGIVGADCTLPPVATAEFGRYTGEIVSSGPMGPEGFTGFLDLEGRLWGVEDMGIPLFGGQPMATRAHHTVVTQPVEGDGQITGTASLARWTRVEADPESWDLLGQWFDDEAGAELTWETENRTRTLTIWPADDDRSLLTPVDAETLAGRWEIPMRDPYFPTRAWLTINPNGHACIDMFPIYQPQGECHFEGWLDDIDDGGIGLLEFVINRPDEDYPIDSYSGRGWVTTGPGGRELVLIGNDGFMLKAHPED